MSLIRYVISVFIFVLLTYRRKTGLTVFVMENGIWYTKLVKELVRSKFIAHQNLKIHLTLL